MAESRSERRRKNTLTSLLGDVIDDAKGLVDDVQSEARRAIRRVLDEDDRGDTSDREIDSLKSAIDDLTVKVNRLAELQAKAARKSGS